MARKGETASVLEAPAEETTIEKDLESLLGVSSATADKLRETRYDNLETIATSMPSELSLVAEIGEDTALKIIVAARKKVEASFELGTTILERRKQIEKITTGSKELDVLIGGGIETQAITEAYGKFGSGKSQLGFQLCVNAQLPKEKGGLASGVLFIDSESTFRPERIAQMAVGAGLDPDAVLANIHVAQAMNSDHQIFMLEKAEPLIREGKIRLIIVDSLTAAFRSDYIGRGELSERQGKLNKHIHALLRYARNYNLAVYVTNQVMDNPGILFGDPTTPIGGHVLAHTSTYRMYLRRSKEDRRIAKLVDSPNLPDGECVFRVTPEGLAD
ncbi:MAG: DNA repair and recombination protein RadA [Candidatus Micrarchaeota archaeon]